MGVFGPSNAQSEVKTGYLARKRMRVSATAFALLSPLLVPSLNTNPVSTTAKPFLDVNRRFLLLRDFELDEKSAFDCLQF